MPGMGRRHGDVWKRSKKRHLLKEEEQRYLIRCIKYFLYAYPILRPLSRSVLLNGAPFCLLRDIWECLEISCCHKLIKDIVVQLLGGHGC